MSKYPYEPGWIFKVFANIVAIPIYLCMAVFVIAVPMLFVGSLLFLVSGQVDTPEEIFGFIFVTFISGVFSYEIYNGIVSRLQSWYESFIKKQDRK